MKCLISFELHVYKTKLDEIRRVNIQWTCRNLTSIRKCNKNTVNSKA